MSLEEKLDRLIESIERLINCFEQKENQNHVLNKKEEENVFLTVKQVKQIYPAFTDSSIRWIIFNESRYDRYKWLKRIGKKILIDKKEFDSWIREQNN